MPWRFAFKASDCCAKCDVSLHGRKQDYHKAYIVTRLSK
jgi:hypothetical protein